MPSISDSDNRRKPRPPRVGVGVMVLKDGRVLLGKRKGSHGEGEYAFPGGHLEYMETFEECARRETREECGIEIENIRFRVLVNERMYAPKHYVYVGFLADWKNGKPEVREPEKCEGWDWYNLTALPEPLFEPSRFSIENYRTGTQFFDTH